MVEKFDSGHMQLRPRFRDGLYVVPMHLWDIQIRVGPWGPAYIIRDKEKSGLLKDLASLLNGEFTIKELLTKLKGHRSKDIINTLRLLYSKGLIEDAPPRKLTGFSSHELNQYKHFLSFLSLASILASVDKYKCLGSLKKSSVCIINLGAIGSRIAVSLASSGVGEITLADNQEIDEDCVYVSRLYYSKKDLHKDRAMVLQRKCRGINPYSKYAIVRTNLESKDDLSNLVEGKDLVILCEEKLNPRECTAVNEACLQRKIKWMKVEMIGLEGIVGPTFIPNETACYKCYELRIRSCVSRYEEFITFYEYLSKNSEVLGGYVSWSPLVDFLACLSSIEAVKILTDLNPITYGCFMLIDFLNTEIEFNNVLKIPRCPSCGRSHERFTAELPWDV